MKQSQPNPISQVCLPRKNTSPTKWVCRGATILLLVVLISHTSHRNSVMILGNTWSPRLSCVPANSLGITAPSHLSWKFAVLLGCEDRGKEEVEMKKKKKRNWFILSTTLQRGTFALLPHAWQHCQVADYSLSLINHLQKSCEKQNGVYPKFIRTKLLNKGQHTAAFLGLQPHNFKKLSAANRSTFQYYSWAKEALQKQTNKQNKKTFTTLTEIHWPLSTCHQSLWVSTAMRQFQAGHIFCCVFGFSSSHQYREGITDLGSWHHCFKPFVFQSWVDLQRKCTFIESIRVTEEPKL